MLIEEKNRIKLILLGDVGVGKSAIIQRFYDNTFEENILTTFNSSFLEKEVTIKGKKVVLEIWDTVGQEQYRSMTQLFVKNSKIIILVYNVTRMKTFESLNYWYDFINKELGSNIVLGLAGNKTDLIFEDNYEEEVSPEKGKEFAEKIGASFALVSAKESGNEIKVLFYELLTKYFDIKDNGRYFSSTIKLDERSFTREVNGKNECCLGKNKKTIKLNSIFLGCEGVGKTSIIKAIKGKEDFINLPHTKKEYKENIHYIRNNQNITVELKEINGEENINQICGKYNEGYKIFFLIFDIYRKDTLYSLEEYIKKINIKKDKIYLFGYHYNSSEFNKSDFNYIDEVERFSKKFGCEYEYLTLDEIYKIKAIIIDNIEIYLSNLGY
jgi:small GTP-binding protein